MLSNALENASVKYAFDLGQPGKAEKLLQECLELIGRGCDRVLSPIVHFSGSQVSPATLVRLGFFSARRTRREAS